MVRMEKSPAIVTCYGRRGAWRQEMVNTRDYNYFNDRLGVSFAGVIRMYAKNEYVNHVVTSIYN